MGRTMFAYLTSAPSLDDLRVALNELGLVYRHTLPADERWNYPMHVFGGEEVRLVYHAGNAVAGEAIIDTSVRRGDAQNNPLVHLILRSLVRRYGGIIHDPQVAGRGSVA
jgi:hypothetical protein